MSNIAQRIEKLISILGQNVYEKEHVFKLSMLALLSGESIFLLGKPGIAKSLVARRIKFALKDGKNFEYLMNKFSTPEEIYGPISIKELIEGNYIRLIKDYLPDVDIAFLDEIWKAGPSIQNTLLTIINEKLFRNGGKDVSVPMKLLISASNELPESGKGLEALFDRFIIRIIVHGLTNEEYFNQMLQANVPLDIVVDPELAIDSKEYKQWLKELEGVKIADSTFQFISRFRKSIYEATKGEVYISDRRWKKISKLIKASAFYNGRTQTDKPDLLIIPYCIWDNEIQEQEYNKLFNELFIEELTFSLKEQQAVLQQELLNIQQTIEDWKSGTLRVSKYIDPFKGYLIGNYYRLIWNNPNHPICFISEDDFRSIMSSPSKKHNVTVYFGPSLNQFDDSAKVTLKKVSNRELVNVKTNQTFILEITDVDDQVGNLDDLYAQIRAKEVEIAASPARFQVEKDRLSALPAIFYDDQWKLNLENAFFNYIEQEPTTIANEVEDQETFAANVDRPVIEELALATKA